MHSKMGSPWCEILIKDSLAKYWLRKLAPFSVGIAFTSSMGGMLLTSRYVNATPCCTDANTTPPTSLSKTSEDVTASVWDKKVEEIACLEPYSSRVPSLSFEKTYSDFSEDGFSAIKNSLFFPAQPPATNENTDIFEGSQVKHVLQASTSLLPIDRWSVLEPESSSCLTSKLAQGITPTPNTSSKIPLAVPLANTTFDQVHEGEHLSSVSVIETSSPEFSPQNTTEYEPGTLPHPTSVGKQASLLINTTESTLSGQIRLQRLDETPITFESSRREAVASSTANPKPSATNTKSPILQLADDLNLLSQANPNPNEERFLQPRPPLTPVPTQPNTEPSVQPSPTPTPTSPEAPSDRTLQVKKINVTGSTIFDAEELNPIVQPYEGRTLTLEELREVADKITQLYLDRGYITSRAVLVDQEITPEGAVEIRVLEGSLEEIRIEGARRIKPSYVRNRVQLGAGKPLNTGKLEDQLRLLRADPLFENVEASLRAGTKVGQSILIVRVTEADPFEGSIGIDNYSPPSVGSERLGLNLLYRNLTGNGDTIAASYYHTTTSGADSFDFSYLIPLNAMNGTLQLRAAPNRTNITQESLRFANIRGESDLYEISFRQPLIRSPREEFALSLGFTYQEGQTFLLGTPFGFGFGPEDDGTSTTSVIKFGQDYLRRDVKGAWSLRSLFNIGVDVLGATTNSEPLPDGQFVSWLGQVQRVQILNENNFLIVGADVQLTPDSLLPSQQFVIGGGQSLRGYRQNIRSGDNGVRFSIEDRITLERNEAGAATFQLAPFFDAGYVWNKADNPNNEFLPSQRFLAGIGLGLIWEPEPGLNLRLDYGYPLVDIDDKGTNAQDKGFYFSVRYQF